MKPSLSDHEIIIALKQLSAAVPLNFLADQLGRHPKTLRNRIKKLNQNRNAPWFVSNNIVHLDIQKNQLFEIEEYWFTAQEIESLIALNNIIEQLLPGGLAEQLKPFETKIKQLLADHQKENAITQKIKLIEIATRKVNPEIFQIVVQSLASDKRLKIHFYNRHTSEHSSRMISPQKLIRYKDNWLLDAYCHLKNNIRSFSVESIQQATLLLQPIQKIEKTELENHFSSSYGIYAGEADKQAIIRFTDYQAQWAKLESWHPNQTGYIPPEGGYQIIIPYHKDEELIQDLLKHGDQVKVIAPEALKQKMKQMIQNTLKHYP